MAKAKIKTKIESDGLHYKAKVTGSPYASSLAAYGSATMSCLLCGKHRARSTMVLRKLCGKNQTVCAPNCKAAEEAAKVQS